MKFLVDKINIEVTTKFPFVWIRPVRMVQFFIQRRVRGFDDSETWSLDMSLAQYIAPRLKRLKELNIGHPLGLTEDEWDGILDEMIEGFELMANPSDCFFNNRKNEKISRALQLFSEYYRDLWW